MFLLAVVAIAVSVIVTAGATSLLSGQAFGAVLGAMTGGAAVGGVSMAAWVAGGAIGGAIGSIASQGVGIAVGAQDKINWKGVALAGIAGGIGGAFQGLGNAAKSAIDGATKALKAGEVLTKEAAKAAVKGSLGSVGGYLASSGVVNSMVRAVISSGLTQGIGKLTGLQDEISWGGIAGAALSGGLASAMNLPGIAGPNGNASVGNILVNFAGSMAGNMVNAAARSLIDGGDFGDNIMAALPDTIAQTIMDVAMRNLSKRAEDKARVEDARSTLAGIRTLDAVDDAKAAGTYSPDIDYTVTPDQISDGDADALAGEAKQIERRNANDPNLTDAKVVEQSTQLLASRSRHPGRYKRATALFDTQPVTTIGPAMQPNSGGTPPVPINLPTEGDVVVHSGGQKVLFNSVADGLAQRADTLAYNVSKKIGEYPLLDSAIKVLDWALWLAGGPVRMVVSSIWNRVMAAGQEQIVGAISNEATGKGFNEDDSRSLARGYVMIAALVVAGATAALGVMKLVSMGNKSPDRPDTADRPPPRPATRLITGLIDPKKFDYLFGRVTSGSHNTARSRQNVTVMKRLGVPDNETGFGMLREHFLDALQDPANIIRRHSVKGQNFETRDSFFAGPSGAFTKFESTWETMPDGSRRFVTAIPLTGKR